MADKKTLTEEDLALLTELGVEVEAKKSVKYTAQEERIIAGFEEIQKFVEEQTPSCIAQVKTLKVESETT